MKERKIIIVIIILIILGALGFGVTRILQSKSQTELTTESVSPNASDDKSATNSTDLQTSSGNTVVSSDNEKPQKDKDSGQAMAGWLEKKLLPGNQADQGEKKIQTWEGWMFDRDCIGINPVKHTKACNLMGTCFTSGLGITPYVQGKSFDTYVALDSFLVFDGNSSVVAQAFLRSLPEDWKDNITIKVTGYAVNNIPTNADETNVPETDASKIDHYLSGIHMTSIEAAYLEGLSTNKLPSPNIVFPKP